MLIVICDWCFLFRVWRKRRKSSRPAVALHFIFRGHKVDKMQTQDNNPQVVTVSPVDIKGNAAPLAPGVTVAFSVDNTAIGTVSPNAADPTGLSCIFTPNPQGGNLGTCNIQA